MSDSAATLHSLLLNDPAKRARVLADAERLVDSEVASKSGLMGMAIKAAYKMVCTGKPGLVRDALDHLLDDFVNRLEPFFAQHRDLGGAGGQAGDAKQFGTYLTRRPGEVADALLGITDDRARRAKNQVLKQAYDRLRPQGKRHVEEAVPGVARLLGSHL